MYSKSSSVSSDEDVFIKTTPDEDDLDIYEVRVVGKGSFVFKFFALTTVKPKKHRFMLSKAYTGVWQKCQL